MKPYAKLRGRMAELDVTGETLAHHIDRSKTYVSNRMSRNSRNSQNSRNYSWTIDEVYKILDFLEVPQSEIFAYFPPNGGLPPQKALRKGKQK